MRQQVLKALANPSYIFYVPYTLAIINFVVLFIIFIAIFITGLVVSGGEIAFNPLYFLIIVIASHLILAGFSKKEPQIAQIVSAKINLYSLKVPKRLIA